MTRGCDVAIIGAGPTGLTLANLLGPTGVSVVLVERNDGTVREPRAVSIDDEALRTMQAAGLIGPVVADVALDYGAHYFTPGGYCFLKVEPTTREYGFPRRSAFAQPKLEATLRAGLGRFANVTTLFGHACESAAEDDDGVALTLRAGDGSAVAVRARYVAACDGGRSMFREIIGTTLTGSTYRQRWLIVDLASTRERLRHTRVVCDPARPLITLPGPDGIRRYEFMLHDDEDEAAASAPEFVRALLAAHGPDADAPIVRRQVYTFHARVADHWSSRRIFLAGDAAHLTPPFAGQGMNSGVRDAHNLAWKFAEVVTGRLGLGLLDSYQRERSPHARALIQLAVKIGRVMMPTSPLQALLVQLAFRLTRLAPRLQVYFAQMKYKPKPFYQAGFVVPDDGGLRLAGRMLPQPTLELADRSRHRLDDVIGNGFALIAYGRDAQTAVAAEVDFGPLTLYRLAVLPADCNPDLAQTAVDTGRDIDDVMATLVTPGRAVILLVRPDRYIAAAALAEPQALARMAASVRSLMARTPALPRVPPIRSPASTQVPGGVDRDRCPNQA